MENGARRFAGRDPILTDRAIELDDQHRAIVFPGARVKGIGVGLRLGCGIDLPADQADDPGWDLPRQSEREKRDEDGRPREDPPRPVPQGRRLIFLMHNSVSKGAFRRSALYTGAA